MRLKDKIAIVTGAGSGFGRGIALRFAAEGARVVVNDLNAENGVHTVENITEAGGDARFMAGDVSRDADVRRLVEFTLATFGGVKHSGHGREKGFEALYGFTSLKTVVLRHG